MGGEKWHSRVEPAAIGVRRLMRKKAYHVTFSIRDACDVRRFRLSFSDGGTINLVRVA